MDCAAGIQCKVVETQRAQHAQEAVRDASLAELQSCDGILAVSPPVFWPSHSCSIGLVGP